jgi:hypothetical protein
MSAALTHSSCSVLPATTRSNHPARPACLHKAAPVVRLAAPTLVRPAQRLQQARPARSVFVRAFDEAALKETAALDELVDALLSAGSQQEVSALGGIFKAVCLFVANALFAPGTTPALVLNAYRAVIHFVRRALAVHRWYLTRNSVPCAHLLHCF